LISKTEEIEAIAEEIRRRTEKEIQEIFKAAEEKARKIIEKAKMDAEKKFQHEVRGRLMIIRRRILGTAEQEARRKIIQAKNEIIQKVYENALRELENIAKGKNPKYDYKEILYQLIREAVIEMEEPEVIIKANEIDQKYLTEYVTQIQQRIKQETGLTVNLKIDNNPVDTIGGIIAQTPDGTKTYHNTLEGRLRKTFDKMKPKLAQILFKE
jgi:V/A-type H+-transporting ATPase subunit E